MVRKGAIFLIMMLTIIIMALAIPGAVQASPDATIKIYTLDDKRLKNAVVQLINSTKTLTKETDSNGEAVFNINETAIYTLKVFYPSGNLVYEDQNFNYSETDNGKVVVNVLSTWTIKVWDSRGRDPVPNANVTITLTSNDSVRYHKITGDNGKVSFGPLPSGSYRVEVKFRDETFDCGSKAADVTHKTVDVELNLYRVNVKVRDRHGSPVEGVEVLLKPSLEEEAVSSASTNPDGKAVLKLVPNGGYYLQAYLKGVLVYQSEGREIEIYHSDEDVAISIDAVKLNITVYDMDGLDVMKGPGLTLRGELKKDGKMMGETETSDGVLRFGHTPFGKFTLKIYLKDLPVYSGIYEVDVEHGDGSVRAEFYDIIIRINTTGLANQTLARSLSGVLRKGDLEYEFKVVQGIAELKNIPTAGDYEIELMFKDKKVAEFKNVKVNKEDQEINLRLEGFVINVKTTNLQGEPISTEIIITLPSGERVTSFKTDENGLGSSAPLLPMSYNIRAYIEGILVAEKPISLTENKNIQIEASVIDVTFRVYDGDGRNLLKNVRLELSSGEFERKGISDEKGEIRLRNIPLHDFKISAWYYGFKVVEDRIKIKSGMKVVDIKAPGVLDARLRFLDSMKNPLDGGTVILNIGGETLRKEIDKSGEVRVEDLPNTTIPVEVFYKGVRVDAQPKEFTLKMDEMSIIFVTRVHVITIKVFRGDGKPLREGSAEIYVNGNLTSTHDLSEENVFSERLPESDLTVRIEFRKRIVGDKTIYLEESMKELNVMTTLYPFGMNVYDPSGKPVRDARLVISDDLGKLMEVHSDEKGRLSTIIPIGKYNLTIIIGNESYSYRIEFRKSVVLNFLYPAKISMGFESIVAVSALNLTISGLTLSRLSSSLKKSRRRRRRRRVPRI